MYCTSARQGMSGKLRKKERRRRTESAMKRKGMILAAVCLVSAGLTGCQGLSMTQGDKYWTAAKREDSLEDYLEEKKDALDWEALRQEAGNSELTLSQRFKATAFLCALEYQSLLEADAEGKSSYAERSGNEDDVMFQMDYPDSAAYARAYLETVNTNEEEFWESLEDAFYPYDYLSTVVAAADELDGQTLANLFKGLPESDRMGDELEKALENWVEAHAGRMPEHLEALTEAEFYGDWKIDEWKNAYFNNGMDPYLIETATADEALQYIGCVRDDLLPRLESEFGEEFKEQSELVEEEYYSTGLAVTVTEELSLQEASEEGLPETVELAGKKVAAFYRNPSQGEFPYAPTSLRLLGDFMLGLPEEEYPETLAEADYYLVLTAAYEYGGMYQDTMGNDTKIQEVFSSTSVDLYEAGTGRFLRHLGNLLEEAPSTIYTRWDDDAPRFPEETAADVLSYLYHNVNEPDKFAYLLDNASGKSELARDESITLGNFEVTYRSCQIQKEFDQGMFRYTADDGCQFVLGEFTVKNIGAQADSFMPMIYNTQEDVMVWITDSSTEETYECFSSVGVSGCVNGSTLEPGESKDGRLIFQLPDEVLQSTDSLYVVVSLGRQSVSYRLQE